MAKNAKVNVLIQNSEWKTPTTQAIAWHPIIEAIPSNSTPKMGQKDEIVWLDSPNHRFSVKVIISNPTVGSVELLRAVSRQVVLLGVKLSDQSKFRKVSQH
jgi:hypothetical protein